jgi:predicted nuclease of predicted toxin-antitoxin system
VKFFIDHDVPGNIALLLRYWGHEATVLREVLPVETSDEDAFAYARAHEMITITCNRSDYLALAAKHPEHPGLIILVRRRTRQTETSRLLMLLQQAGEQGLANNINFA